MSRALRASGWARARTPGWVAMAIASITATGCAFQTAPDEPVAQSAARDQSDPAVNVPPVTVPDADPRKIVLPLRGEARVNPSPVPWYGSENGGANSMDNNNGKPPDKNGK